jgi:hypothetical protein
VYQIDAKNQLEGVVYQLSDLAREVGKPSLERSAKAARDWIESPVPRSVSEYNTRREQLEDLMASYM